MKTNVVYNNIPINDFNTESINQEVVMDRTGVDPIGIRVTIVGTGLVTRFAPAADSMGLGTNNAFLATGYSAVVDDLLQPRRRFRMTIGNAILWDIYPFHQSTASSAAHKIDIENGPQTKVRLARIISGHTASLEFTVSFMVPYSDRGGRISSVINFRFWTTEEIDGNDWTSTRTYNGRIRLRHRGYNAIQELRNNFQLPPLSKGFERKAVRIMESSDGLEADFTVVDKEVYAVAPSPGVTWDAHHIVSTSTGGAVFEGEIRILLRGDKATPKTQLISLAIAIGNAKLHNVDMYTSNLTIPLYVAVDDHMNANEITFVARVEGGVRSDADLTTWGLFAGTLGMPLSLPGYDKEFQKQCVDTASLSGLLIAAFTDQDPYHVANMPGCSYPNSIRRLRYERCDITLAVIPSLLTRGGGHDYNYAEMQRGAYVHYEMESAYYGHSGRQMFPYARSAAGTDDTSRAIRIKPECLYRDITLSASRINKPPRVPAAKDFTETVPHKLIDYTILPKSPALSPDSRKRLHSVEAWYRYGLTRPFDFSVSGLPIGHPPLYSSASVASALMDADSFDDPGTAFSILGSSTPTLVGRRSLP